MRNVEISFPNTLLIRSAARLMIHEWTQHMHRFNDYPSLEALVNMIMDRFLAANPIREELRSVLYGTLYILGVNVRDLVIQARSDRTGFFVDIDDPPVTNTLSIDRANLLCRQREHTADDPLCDNCMTTYVMPLWSLLKKREQIVYERLFAERKYEALAIWVQHSPEPLAATGSPETALIREIPSMVEGHAMRMLKLRNSAHWLAPSVPQKEIEFKLDGPENENMLRLCVHCGYFGGVQRYWREISNDRKNQMRAPLLQLARVQSRPFVFSGQQAIQIYDYLMISVLLMKDYNGSPMVRRDLMVHYLQASDDKHLRMDPAKFLQNLNLPMAVVVFWFQYVVNVVITTTND